MGSEVKAGRLPRSHHVVNMHIPMETCIASYLQGYSNPSSCSDKKVHVAFLHNIAYFPIPRAWLVFLLSSHCYTCKIGTRVTNSAAADWIKLQFSKVPGKEKNRI